ncbi:two-component system response regulator NarL [Shewanella woodyi]|uniref:Two component transcriptional regulator, LuxR family n=1 Tax=Shewanella woodyi (strain ATCC 51908 / MS32) TaxID=392500 RepID=B1KHM9_SHEWM|nr:two-component system response regulator NarL [Shewanella woodyi]ACA86914.1 two component transcriptional regulator, LuxR family [Shewanella woodyi ATCC 51908]
MTRAQILLVDDHPTLRQGLAQLISLEDNLDVIAQAGSGDEAISLAIKHAPDLILLDLNMKGLSGIDTLIALKRAEIDSKIVIFTVSDSESDVLQAIKFNTDGYLLKDSEPEELIEKINLAIQGEFVISAPLTKILARSLRPESKASSPLENLTQRELQNLKLIASGKSNKDIANTLGIAETTVKVHVKNLLKKLGLKSRVEAAVWAVEHKIGH